MSGKHSQKNTSRKKHSSQDLGLTLIACLIAAGLLFMLLRSCSAREKAAAQAESAAEAAESAAAAVVPEAEASDAEETDEEAEEAVLQDLGGGLVITGAGQYTGAYVEDGSDEMVSGVLMLSVANRGENAIQYAEISLPVGEETASFSLTTLLPGSTMILLEQNRMAYDASVNYSGATAAHVAFFQEEPSLREDILDIQVLDGALNIANISGADIPGTITIYYKNRAADVYYGGITYRVILEDGLAANEVRQIMAGHVSRTSSALVFVTCSEG